MRLSGAAWSFVGATLVESVVIWRALGVNTVDLLACPGGLLESARIAGNPAAVAEEVLNAGASVENLIYLFAGNFSDRALNHSDASVREQNRKDFEGVVEFCRRAGVRSITVLPGIEQPGWTREKSLSTAGRALTELAGIAQRAGITLLFEAHVQSLLESPADTYEFLMANSGLQLTLDYSHFIWSGHSQEEVDVLAPFAGHVHLRQAAPQRLQTRWDDGTIDFGRVFEVLQASGYQGGYALEYEHDAWLGNDQVDVITESIKMRNLVWSRRH